MSPVLFMAIFFAGIFRLANYFVSSGVMDQLKQTNPGEWKRLGKPVWWWNWSHFWWFWYVLFASYKERVEDEDTLSWLAINRVLHFLEICFAVVASSVWYWTI